MAIGGHWNYPNPTEIDNIALRRELGRRRQELTQQVSAQQLCLQKADQLGIQISELRVAKLEYLHERACLEAAIQGLRLKLERKSIKNKVRRALRILNGARPVEA